MNFEELLQRNKEEISISVKKKKEIKYILDSILKPPPRASYL